MEKMAALSSDGSPNIHLIPEKKRPCCSDNHCENRENPEKRLKKALDKVYDQNNFDKIKTRKSQRNNAISKLEKRLDAVICCKMTMFNERDRRYKNRENDYLMYKHTYSGVVTTSTDHWCYPFILYEASLRELQRPICTIPIRAGVCPFVAMLVK